MAVRCSSALRTLPGRQNDETATVQLGPLDAVTCDLLAQREAARQPLPKHAVQPHLHCTETSWDAASSRLLAMNATRSGELRLVAFTSLPHEAARMTLPADERYRVRHLPGLGWGSDTALCEVGVA